MHLVLCNKELGWIIKKQEPFLKLPTRILRDKELNPSEKIILFLLADLSPAFPSYEKLSEWSGLPRRTVARCLSSLKKQGWIKAEPFGRGRKYKVFNVRQIGTHHDQTTSAKNDMTSAKIDIDECHTGTPSILSIQIKYPETMASPNENKIPDDDEIPF